MESQHLDDEIEISFTVGGSGLKGSLDNVDDTWK